MALQKVKVYVFRVIRGTRRNISSQRISWKLRISRIISSFVAYFKKSCTVAFHKEIFANKSSTNNNKAGSKVWTIVTFLYA